MADDLIGKLALAYSMAQVDGERNLVGPREPDEDLRRFLVEAVRLVREAVAAEIEAWLASEDGKLTLRVDEGAGSHFDTAVQIVRLGHPASVGARWEKVHPGSRLGQVAGGSGPGG